MLRAIVCWPAPPGPFGNRVLSLLRIPNYIVLRELFSSWCLEFPASACEYMIH